MQELKTQFIVKNFSRRLFHQSDVVEVPALYTNKKDGTRHIYTFVSEEIKKDLDAVLKDIK